MEKASSRTSSSTLKEWPSLGLAQSQPLLQYTAARIGLRDCKVRVDCGSPIHANLVAFANYGCCMDCLPLASLKVSEAQRTMVVVQISLYRWSEPIWKGSLVSVLGTRRRVAFGVEGSESHDGTSGHIPAQQ